MRRVFGWTLVGGLLSAVASTASAQVSVTFGNPYMGTGVTFGGYGVTPGYAYGNPSYGSPSYYAPQANTAPGYGSGAGSGYPGTYSNSGYNSAYSGYPYPGTTSYSYRTYSSGYGPTYRYPSYGSNSSGYGYPSYGSRRGPYLIRIR